jgi:hypothetical protein
MLERVWQPAADLLHALQGAIDASLPPYFKPLGQDQGAYVWLAGGALRAALTGETPRDLDFCFATPSALAVALDFLKASYDHTVLPVPEHARHQGAVVTKLLVRLDCVHETGVPLLGRQIQRSFSDACTKVDLVRRFAPSPLDTARQMDFVCCAAALSTKTYARHARFEEDVAAKVLDVNAPWAPRASLRRVERFVERGWSISDAAKARLQALAGDPHLPEWDFHGSPGGVVRPESEGWDYDAR